MELAGKNLIGGEWSGGGKRQFYGIEPMTGEKLEPVFYEVTWEEIRQALEMAQEAFAVYRQKTPGEIAGFLEGIAAGIEELGDRLIRRASMETALDENRLRGERGRTVNQIRMFAQEVREGSWKGARIDTADPARKPVPKADIRQMLIPLGPVVVFAASNFPLAFSAAGGDTISALAAGNPVVVKAHPGHPGTAELVARAILAAARQSNMPPGIFSMVHGVEHRVGLELVTHPLTQAVAFTGSLKGGRALFDAAASRPRPIPVYAEMGSINPVFVLPAALKEKGDEIARQLAQSVTLGVGQFCTNPGLVAGIKSDALELFIQKLVREVSQIPAGIMIYAGIQESYQRGIKEFLNIPGVELAGESGNRATPAVLVTSAAVFLDNDRLAEEVFGPSTLVVQSDTPGQLLEVAQHLQGQLTATIQATGEDLRRFPELISILECRVGRLLYGGVPTGVEVCPAMHHGGPYPAATDIRSTSVGSLALQRFVRPVCYQNFPLQMLPPELQDKNIRRIWRLLNNRWMRDDVIGSREKLL